MKARESILAEAWESGTVDARELARDHGDVGPEETRSADAQVEAMDNIAGAQVKARESALAEV